MLWAYMQAMKSEKLKLTQETKGLQASMSLLKVTHHTETEWKKIESQHKVLTGESSPAMTSHPLLTQELQNKCASLNSSLKFMQTTMEAKSSELASALDRWVVGICGWIWLKMARLSSGIIQCKRLNGVYFCDI